MGKKLVIRCANSVISGVYNFLSVNNEVSHQILIDHDWSTCLLISVVVQSSNKIVQNQDLFTGSL